jgi:hypothetical protein
VAAHDASSQPIPTLATSLAIPTLLIDAPVHGPALLDVASTASTSNSVLYRIEKMQGCTDVKILHDEEYCSINV